MAFALLLAGGAVVAWLFFEGMMDREYGEEGRSEGSGFGCTAVLLLLGVLFILGMGILLN